MLKRPSRTAVAAIVVAPVAALAASLGPTAASASGTQILRISAKPQMLAFNMRHLHAHRGRIEIIMTNPANSGISHGISVEGHGVDKDGKVVAPGHRSILTVTLTKKGDYTYYCPVSGHAAAGMRGTLTIS